jgi:hypothetical protein
MMDTSSAQLSVQRSLVIRIGIAMPLPRRFEQICTPKVMAKRQKKNPNKKFKP